MDEESSPYASKYKARTLLDQIVAKLEATKTIAMLEKKRYYYCLQRKMLLSTLFRHLIESMDCRIASARVRLGTISWEVIRIY